MPVEVVMWLFVEDEFWYFFFKASAEGGFLISFNR